MSGALRTSGKKELQPIYLEFQIKFGWEEHGLNVSMIKRYNKDDDNYHINK